ncbi:hypothetical protein AAUPMB_05683 [Pasteurella multocida subsp. multocida str. Anand1_buffalo]|nr:hypothetical protein AAUPMB_05683 [Pasteurella multocida subsp. multocida str. Anand1_buffalo]
MNILITGATGLIGSHLTSQLIKHAHGVTALVRDPKAAKQTLPASVTLISSLAQYTTLDTFDAVINLAGEPIFEKRWTAQQKQRLVESRVNLTAQLVQRINASRTPPHTFISGSATGYYGHNAEENHHGKRASNRYVSQAQIVPTLGIRSIMRQKHEFVYCVRGLS